MSTRLLTVRHGETLWNREGRCQGFSDIPLNPAGEEQAVALARSLKDAPLAGVYCSDLVRARRTAELIAAPHKLPLQTDARLRELNQGKLEGKSLNNLLSDHPELLKQWMDAPADVTMPGGESMRSLQLRAWQAVLEIIRLHPDQTALVVCHNLASRAIICQAIGLDLNHFRRLRIDTGSLTEIHFSANPPVLVRINDTHHLK